MAAAPTPVAKLGHTEVKGTKDGAVDVYWGIPFARPPIGELRLAAPEPMEAEEMVSLEEADAEENTGKVKAVVPETEEDIEIDETIEDDDDDDSTFIADEEEGDEDVTDIIGDVGGDEET